VAWSPEDSLVIGISSRALFKLDDEDSIYHEQGLQPFIDYIIDHEGEPVGQGVAFPLIKALLELNTVLRTDGKPAIEVVLVSRNHPECAIRINRSLQNFGLKVRRVVLTGGGDPLPFLKAFKVGLFLTNEETAVSAALNAGISAGLIHGGPQFKGELDGTPVIAFDGDAVLFSDQSDQAYKQGKLPGFRAFEAENATVPLPPGPLQKFAMALERLRENYPIEAPPFKIALVTARDIEFCERPIRTLRQWGIRLDHAAFCSDMSKAVVLAALNPLIFFDDSLKNCEDASACAPTVRIPAMPKRAGQKKVVVAMSSAADASTNRPDRFLTVCKLYLRKNFDEHEQALRVWHDTKLAGLDDGAFDGFNGELERSAKGTPTGRQRRASAAENEDFDKLILFLENAVRKHSK
jgi:5'-nucleotidase